MKTTTNRHSLRMTKTAGDLVVIFAERPNNTMRVYTYATWTDYTTDFTVSVEEARETWKRLVGEGFKRAPIAA